MYIERLFFILEWRNYSSFVCHWESTNTGGGIDDGRIDRAVAGLTSLCSWIMREMGICALNEGVGWRLWGFYSRNRRKIKTVYTDTDAQD